MLRPLEHLRQTRGIAIKTIPFLRRTYACDFEKLTAQFQIAPPSLLCLTHASNVCGLMPPVVKIAHLAKQVNPNAVVVVDGAQTAGLYPLPLTNGLIDAFTFSGHKSLYGPYGVAGLVLGSKWRPEPLLFGGTGTISESIKMPTDLPSAYEAGSHNIWAIAGLQAALSWLQDTGRETIVNHTMKLGWQLRDGLTDLYDITLHVPPAEIEWCGILSFTIADTPSQAIEVSLGAQDIAVRAGLHCSPWVHEWLGTMTGGGTVRVSPGYFGETSQVELVLGHLANITNR